MTPDSIHSPAETSAPVLHLVLRPHRSLSLGGFKVLMAVVVMTNLIGAFAFALAGAWPVLPFFGLDIAALWLAFRANYRAASGFETIHIDHAAVTLERRGFGEKPLRVSRPTLWSRFELEQADEEQPPHLFFCFRMERHEIGRDLPPAERPLLAKELRRALAQAKSSPQLSGGRDHGPMQG